MSQSTRSKGTRSSTPIARSVAAESTSSDSRPASPTSHPLLYSRRQEKDNLQNLNDRLASYIDTVRQLQSDNATLYKRIQSAEESTAKEVSTVKSMYESQLEQSRKQLDNITKTRAALQIDYQKAVAEREELQTR